MPTEDTVRNNEELARWLSASVNPWLEDAEVNRLKPAPGQPIRPETVVLTVTEHVGGSRVAGCERVVRDIELCATGVTHTTLDDSLAFAIGHVCQGIELDDVANGIAFRIDVPGTLEVHCAELRILPSEERTELVRPWISDNDLSLAILGAPLPTPDEWLRRFAAHGIDVCWRAYGEPASVAPENPTDCTGWFLQRPDRIPSTTGGLFFFGCTERDDQCVTHLQLRESGDDSELWQAVQNVAAGFERAAISCGNCEFSTQQWREHLATGWLPGS